MDKAVLDKLLNSIKDDKAKGKKAVKQKSYREAISSFYQVLQTTEYLIQDKDQSSKLEKKNSFKNIKYLLIWKLLFVF